MTTALQGYTSALVTPSLRVLTFEDLTITTGSGLFLSGSGENHTDRLRYIQNITTDNQIRDTSLWKNISALECAEYNTLQTDTSTLLIVIKETFEQGFAYQDPRLVPWGSPNYSNLLTAFLQHQLYYKHNTWENGFAKTSKWHTRISYCLSRKVPPGRNCLEVHLWLLLAATVLNAIKLGCLFFTFKEQQKTPLITTGDAIVSFLRSPCVYSAGMCLLSQEELVRKLEERQDDHKLNATPTHKEFKARRLRYYRSVSISRWIIYVSSYEHP
jgi:hypothetical protein